MLQPVILDVLLVVLAEEAPPLAHLQYDQVDQVDDDDDQRHQEETLRLEHAQAGARRGAATTQHAATAAALTRTRSGGAQADGQGQDGAEDVLRKERRKNCQVITQVITRLYRY